MMLIGGQVHQYIYTTTTNTLLPLLDYAIQLFQSQPRRRFREFEGWMCMRVLKASFFVEELRLISFCRYWFLGFYFLGFCVANEISGFE